MKRNGGGDANGDVDEKDHHNFEKRNRRSGGTTTITTVNTSDTTTTTTTTAADTVNLHSRSLSNMNERKNNIGERNDMSAAVVAPSIVAPPQYDPPPLPYPDSAHHYHHHPYQHHHHHQPPQNCYQHTVPAQVLPEEETPTSFSNQQQQVSHIPTASIRDDEDHDDIIDKNIYIESNATSHFMSTTGHSIKTDHLSNDNNNSIDVNGKNVNEADTHEKNRDIENNNDVDVDDNNNIDRATSQDYYFDSYAHHAIHEEMLKDEVRTKTYEMAICQNKHLFQDKIVLDVGCGTGILSMFAARAGAKHIYAVDCSSIIVQAQKIININGLSNKITLIRGKVEDIDLPVDTVDIIISEWMGYFLLYESMLDTVLFARDKWLVKTNGIIFPDKAVMYITAIEDGNVRRDRFDYWDDVYGFDMSPIKEIALREPVVDVVDAKALVTDGVPILSLDILTCTKEDLDFTSHFKLQALRNDYIHGLVAYFECAFTQIHKPIGFSTSPMARYTHWKQTILYLPEPLTVCAGEVLMGEISCQPNERNRRDLDIGLTLTFQGRYSECVNKKIPYRLR